MKMTGHQTSGKDLMKTKIPSQFSDKSWILKDGHMVSCCFLNNAYNESIVTFSILCLIYKVMSFSEMPAEALLHGIVTMKSF